ncbi:MAG TPA: hypothetical protein VLA37_06150, partial [Sphingomonadaceae bacterium]|nr:hypothetical protein [Sphingomonadaceae bacterium]
MARAVALAGLLLALAPPPALAEESCAMAPADQQWLAASLDQWREVLRTELRLTDQTLPTVWAVDAHCTFSLPGGSFAGMTAAPHPVDSAALPVVGTIPIGPISFAFAADGFAMSLPSVWRASGVSSPLGLERLMTGVLLHEIMHTRQAQMIGAVVEPAAYAAGLGDDDIHDDFVQERFAEVPGYRAAYEAERDTLFAAATVPDHAGARGLAA